MSVGGGEPGWEAVFGASFWEGFLVIGWPGLGCRVMEVGGGRFGSPVWRKSEKGPYGRWVLIRGILCGFVAEAAGGAFLAI